MKKIIWILLAALSLSACQPQETNTSKPNACDPTESCDTEKEETKVIDFEVIEMEEALDYFKNQGNAILFFGYKDCPWCQAAAPILKEVEQETGQKVLYVKTRDDEKHELLYSDIQRDELTQYIGAWMDENEEEDNKLWLYVPLLIRVENGVATDGHNSTVEDHDASKREMTEEEKEELKEIYTSILSK